MVARSPRLRYTFADYLRHEATSRDKHEYVAGLILAMAGGTLEHGALATQVAAALVAQLVGRPCRVFSSDARVRVVASGHAYYPDASVVCGTLERDVEDPESMVNPILLLEVLSPSTEEYECGDKLLDYQQIASLRHVVHVAHDSRRIDVWTRGESSWELASFAPGQIAKLPALDAELDVNQVYADPLDV